MEVKTPPAGPPKGQKFFGSFFQKRTFLPALLKSAALRFALLYAVLFGISALALATFVWWQTAGLFQRQIVAAINADVQGLSEQWTAGGTPALLLTIRGRLAANPNDLAIYLLADRNFEPILGNLSEWPRGVTMREDWFELKVTRDGISSLARIHRFDLPDGFHLLVGRDAEVGAQLRHLLTAALFWAMLVVIGLGVIGAVVIRGFVQRSLAGVFATAQAISAGDLAQRVPRSGRGDEFDGLAEAINAMLDRIARLMDGVRHVTDAIAHDLRTPITRVRMRLEDAALNARGEAALHAAIDRAQIELDGVVEIFQALLRITEIESGSRRSAFAPFDAVVLMRDLAEFYEAMVDEKQCRLEVRLPAEAWTLGDQALVQQAIANLIGNALKFSPAGSAIGLVITASQDLRIAVTDRGRGMSEAERAQAAERFYRAEAARSTPGNGLGLSLVEAVAHLHGGTLVLLDNAPGLRAEIRLPSMAAVARPRVNAAL